MFCFDKGEKQSRLKVGENGGRSKIVFGAEPISHLVEQFEWGLCILRGSWFGMMVFG